MTSLYFEREINAPASAVWARISELNKLDTLMEILTDAKVEGDIRTLTMADGGEIVEQILGVDQKNKRVAYAIQTSPFGMTAHAASMQVQERDGKTFLVWTTDIKPDYVADQLRSTLAQEADTMARRLSTRISPDRPSHRRRRHSR